MIDKNPQALALAFKKCEGKTLKIKELGITPDLDEDAIEALIEKLSEAKAASEPGTEVADHVKGQRWYVESLVAFSALSVTKRLDAEYHDAFADSASEAEMIEALTKLAA